MKKNTTPCTPLFDPSTRNTEQPEVSICNFQVTGHVVSGEDILRFPPKMNPKKSQKSKKSLDRDHLNKHGRDPSKAVSPIPKFEVNLADG